MSKGSTLPLCDFAEVFAQLEAADIFTLKKVEIEITRIRREKERSEGNELSESAERRCSARG